MIIERQLSYIEKNFREKNIQLAFKLFSDLKAKYSKNQREDYKISSFYFRQKCRR